MFVLVDKYNKVYREHGGGITGTVSYDLPLETSDGVPLVPRVLASDLENFLIDGKPAEEFIHKRSSDILYIGRGKDLTRALTSNANHDIPKVTGGIENLIETWLYFDPRGCLPGDAIYLRGDQFGKCLFEGIEAEDYIKIKKVRCYDLSIDEEPEMYVKAKLHPMPWSITPGNNVVHCGILWRDKYPFLADEDFCGLFIGLEKASFKESLRQRFKDFFKK